MFLPVMAQVCLLLLVSCDCLPFSLVIIRAAFCLWPQFSKLLRRVVIFQFVQLFSHCECSCDGFQAFYMLAWQWNFEFAFLKLFSNEFLFQISFSLEKVIVSTFCLEEKEAVIKQALWKWFYEGRGGCKQDSFLLPWGLLHICTEVF